MLSLYGQTLDTMLGHASAFGFWMWLWMQDGRWWG